MTNRLFKLVLTSTIVGTVLGVLTAFALTSCTTTGKQTEQSKANARERQLDRPTHRSN